MKLIVTLIVLLVCGMNFDFGQSDVVEPVCKINGQSFAMGETVGKVIDGCNNCNCGRSWFGCTRMACPWYTPSDCEIEGQEYKNYDVIPSADCEECRCMNGNQACANCLP